jgi:hypothetical protein
MEHLKWVWYRRRSFLQQGIVLLAGMMFAGVALLASFGNNGVAVSASTIALHLSAPPPLAATDLRGQKDATPQTSVRGQTAPSPGTGPVVPYRGHEVDRRVEIADMLHRQGDIAWQAGDMRAAVRAYQQSWAVRPAVSPTTVRARRPAQESGGQSMASR